MNPEGKKRQNCGSIICNCVGFVFDPLIFILAIPIVVNELVLAGWLIVKGFNSSGE